MTNYAFDAALWSFFGFIGGYALGTVEAAWWKHHHHPAKREGHRQ